MRFLMNAITPGRRHMLCATFLFSIMVVLVKYLSRIPFVEVAFARSFVSLLFCILLMYRSKNFSFGKNRSLLIIRSLLGTTGLLCYFYSIQHIPLASAVTIINLAPMLTIFFAGLFFGEKPMTWIQWIFLATAFLGVLIVKGFDTRISAADLGVTLMTVICSSLAYNSVRRLNKTDSPLIVVFYFSAVGTLILGPLSASSVLAPWVWPKFHEILLLIVVGIIVQISQTNLTKAYQLESPSRISYLDHLSIFYSLLTGYFIFGESIPPRAALGIFIILLSVIGVTYRPSSYRL